jgi:hypothetical protein
MRSYAGVDWAAERHGVRVCDEAGEGLLAATFAHDLCQIARAQLRFIVPLRVQSGLRERFLADVGHDGLRALRYVSEREQRLPAQLRTKYRGALRDWELKDPQTGEPHRFQVAYIHSSEEQREVASARERALAKAEEQLQRVRNGLGGPHYKTRRQVDARVARILAGQLENLIGVKTTTRNGRLTITWARTTTRSPPPPRPTGSTRWRPTSPTSG